MKKFLLFLTFSLSLFSVGAYFESTLFYTFHPMEKVEVTKTDISHKELRAKGIIPETGKGYKVTHTKRYLYEGHYFYTKKVLVDTSKNGYDVYDISF